MKCSFLLAPNLNVTHFTSVDATAHTRHLDQVKIPMCREFFGLLRCFPTVVRLLISLSIIIIS